jgi:hypothetical protein
MGAVDEVGLRGDRGLERVASMVTRGSVRFLGISWCDTFNSSCCDDTGTFNMW